MKHITEVYISCTIRVYTFKEFCYRILYPLLLFSHFFFNNVCVIALSLSNANMPYASFTWTLCAKLINGAFAGYRVRFLHRKMETSEELTKNIHTHTHTNLIFTESYKCCTWLNMPILCSYFMFKTLCLWRSSINFFFFILSEFYDDNYQNCYNSVQVMLRYMENVA